MTYHYSIPHSNKLILLSKDKVLDVVSNNLLALFTAIPKETTHLDASCLCLDKLTMAEIREAFAHLPAGLISLNLSHNDLGLRTEAELEEFWSLIPSTVTELGLATNQFSKKTAAAFTNFPKHIKTLDFGRNYTIEDNINQFAELITAITQNVTTLKLASCCNTYDAPSNLPFNLSQDLLNTIFAALPSTVILDVGGIGVSDSTSKQAQKISLLPPNVISVSLLELYNIERDYLSQLLQALPASVKKLALPYSTVLRDNMDLVPKTVTSLHINLFRYKLATNLSLVEDEQYCIPDHITALELSDLEWIDYDAHNHLLPPALSQIKTLTLRWDQILRFPINKALAISSRFPKLEELILLDDFGIPKQLTPQEMNLLQAYGFNSKIPSMWLQNKNYDYQFSSDLRNVYDDILIQNFCEIPDHVTILEVTDLKLGLLRSTPCICNAFAAIPPSVTVLDLSYSFLYKKTDEELVEIFASIPKSVTTVILDGNRLSEKSVAAFANFPKHIKTVNFARNYAYGSPEDNFAQIIAAISQHLEVLQFEEQDSIDQTRIGNSSLMGLEASTINNFLKDISETVSLDLGAITLDNGFNQVLEKLPYYQKM